MRIGFRRLLVAFLAVIFAASGISSQSCLAMPPSVANAIAEPHSHLDLHQLHSTSAKPHHDHGFQAAAPAADTEQQPVNDHSSMKCYNFCLISGIAPATLNATTIFAVSPVSFALASQNFPGRAIPIDPRIPKRIV